MSLPSWGAWIEIGNPEVSRVACEGRSPHGERGLKSEGDEGAYMTTGRSPHGECGLK